MRNATYITSTLFWPRQPASPRRPYVPRGPVARLLAPKRFPLPSSVGLRCANNSGMTSVVFECLSASMLR